MATFTKIKNNLDVSRYSGEVLSHLGNREEGVGMIDSDGDLRWYSNMWETGFDLKTLKEAVVDHLIRDWSFYADAPVVESLYLFLEKEGAADFVGFPEE